VVIPSYSWFCADHADRVSQYDPNLLKFIQEGPTMVAARVMTGLQSTSSSHAMNYLLTVSARYPMFITPARYIYEDAGLPVWDEHSKRERIPGGKGAIWMMTMGSEPSHCASNA
jgi:hypothetical protein